MRFNCQSCGAKYQIADEKVAGKTVRMKCRKCDNLIQVRAQSTVGGLQAVYSETPVSSQPGLAPRPAPPSGPGFPPGPISRPGVPISRPGARPAPPVSRPSGGLPRPSAIGPPRPSGQRAPISVPRPAGVGAPRSSGLRSQTGTSGARPAYASGGIGLAARAEQPRADEDESTVVMERPVPLMHDLLHKQEPVAK